MKSYKEMFEDHNQGPHETATGRTQRLFKCADHIFMSVFINDIMNFLVGEGFLLFAFFRCMSLYLSIDFFSHDLLLLCTITIVNEWSTCM